MSDDCARHENAQREFCEYFLENEEQTKRIIMRTEWMTWAGYAETHKPHWSVVVVAVGSFSFSSMWCVNREQTQVQNNKMWIKKKNERRYWRQRKMLHVDSVTEKNQML